MSWLNDAENKRRAKESDEQQQFRNKVQMYLQNYKNALIHHKKLAPEIISILNDIARVSGKKSEIKYDAPNINEQFKYYKEGIFQSRIRSMEDFEREQKQFVNDQEESRQGLNCVRDRFTLVFFESQLSLFKGKKIGEMSITILSYVNITDFQSIIYLNYDYDYDKRTAYHPRGYATWRAKIDNPDNLKKVLADEWAKGNIIQL